MSEAAVATQPVSMDQLTAKYIEIRDKKADLVAKHKEEVAELDKELMDLEISMLQQLQAMGIDSARTKNGTVYKTVSRKVAVADWDTVLEFIQQNEFWSMLERRVSKAAVEQYETETGELPPGLNVHSEYKVNVRRS